MTFSRRTVALLVLALLALGLRLAVVALLWTDTAGPVAYEHGRIAENLLAGRGFSIEFLGVDGPTSQQAPFYPFLLAGAYACFGVGSSAAHLAVQLLQCVAGVGLVLAVAWLAWSLFPERPSVGWLAAALAAVYPTHLYMVTHLQVALWAALLLALLLGGCVSARWRGTMRGAIAAGLLAGAILLVEPILALAIPICAIAFWLGEPRSERWHRGLGRVAVMAGVAVLVIAPWTLRNCAVHGQFVFVKSTFGYAFWQGNHPISHGTDKIPKPNVEAILLDHDGSLADQNRALWDARHETLYIDDVVLKPNGYKEFAGLTEPQRSKLLERQAFQFIADDPARYAGLCLQRLRYFLLFDETNPKAAQPIYRATTAVWATLALIAFLVSWRERRLWPAFAIFAVVALFHTLVIVSTRFRIPVEPLSFVWIAAGMSPLLVRLFAKKPAETVPEPRVRHVLQGPHFGKCKTRDAVGNALCGVPDADE